ncbi:tyrosine-type recombinase/integrase, partial [Nocardioides aquaticus]
MARPPLPIGSWGNVSITKQARGGFIASARFRDTDGVTRVVTANGTTANKASNALKVKLTQRAAPAGDGVLSRESTVANLADLWLEEVKAGGSIRESTYDGYKAIVERRIRKPLGALRLREASVGRLDAHVKKISNDLGKPTEARHTKTVLGMMFDLAVRHDVLLANPARSVTKVSRPKNEVQVLDGAGVREVYELIGAWSNRQRTGPKTNADLAHVVALHLATGCRIGEVLALRWSEVVEDADGMWVTVTGTVIQPRKGSLYRQDLPKTETGFRRLLLPDWAAEVLRLRRDQARETELDGIFLTRNDTWVSPNNLRRQWRAARKGSDLEWVTPRTFRKTVATTVRDTSSKDEA